MEEEVNKKLDELTRRLLTNLSIDSPSMDFTTKVMSTVETLENKKIYEYKPIISQKSWMLIGGAVVLIFSYLFLGDFEGQNSWSGLLNWDWTTNFDSVNLPNFEVSNIFLYAIIGFTFFVSIQVILLKNHFNKRLA